MGRASRRRAAARAGQVPAVQAEALRWDAPVEPATARTHASLYDLADAAKRRRHIDTEIDQIVQLLVARGVGWGDIGRALGISRQGARQRYGRC
jgi:hypothetical protein